jgi:hypothetical protein
MTAFSNSTITDAGLGCIWKPPFSGDVWCHCHLPRPRETFSRNKDTAHYTGEDGRNIAATQKIIDIYFATQDSVVEHKHE